VLACPEPEGADGPITTVITATSPGKKAKERQRGCRPAHYRIRQVPGGMAEKLGQADSENICDRSLDTTVVINSPVINSP
jgi:hypothetical protein